MGREADEKVKRRILTKEKLLPIIDTAFEESGEFELVVTGTSMQPFLVDRRDRVLLAKCQVSNVKKGDILLYTRSDGSLVLHRVYRVCRDSTFEIVGDNQWQLEKGVPQGCVVARVTKCVRNGKVIVCGKSFLDRLMKLWLVRLKAPRFFAFATRCAGYIKRTT